MKKHFLLLSPFFHPEPISTGKYNTYLAKTLANRGISVDVLCFHPLYPDWRPHHADDELGDVDIKRGGSWIRYPKGSLLRRAVLEGSFLLHLLLNAGRIRRYSHIVAVLPPMLFLPFIRIVADPGTRITAIVHDLQGIMAGIGLGKNRSMVVNLIRIVERGVLKCCHRIIALSHAMASILTDRYQISASKIAICWPFITVDTNHEGMQLAHLFADDKKHIVYAGALGEKQNPEGLISLFLDTVNRRSDVVCHIFSRGPIFSAYKQNLKIRHHRLRLHDLVSEQDLSELYCRSNIQVVPEKIGFSGGAVPSKLPNLMAAGVPVLYIGQKHSDVWQVIQETKAGRCADNWNVGELGITMDQLILDNTDRSHKDRRQAFEKIYSTRFSIDALIKELVRHH